MSALLRQLLTEVIELRQAGGSARDPLFDVIGLAGGPEDGVTSADLDQFQYGHAEPRSRLRLVAESPNAVIARYTCWANTKPACRQDRQT